MTPDLHRVHHSSRRRETDSDYGAVFPIWDMLLGTCVAQPRDPHETMELGLEQPRGVGAHRGSERCWLRRRRGSREAPER